MRLEKGSKVMIIEDCRENGEAAGKIATIEGYFEVCEDFESPKMILEDGSVIWGYECWWQPAEEVEDLEQAQIALESVKAFYRAMVDIVSEQELGDETCLL